MTCSAIKKELSEIYIKFTKINNTKIVGKKVNAKNLEINPCCCMYSSI